MRFIRGEALSSEQIDVLAEALVDTFGYAYPSWTIAEAAAELTNTDGLPITICAIDDAGHVIGCASLLAHDEVDGMSAVTPWLGNVWVRADARSQGVGSGLIAAVAQLARARGFESLHLVTEASADWYRKRGWSDLGDVAVHGQTMRWMRKPLLLAPADVEH